MQRRHRVKMKIVAPVNAKTTQPLSKWARFVRPCFFGRAPVDIRDNGTDNTPAPYEVHQNSLLNHRAKFVIFVLV